MKEVYTVVMIQRCYTDAGWDGFFPQRTFASKEAAEKWMMEKQEKRRDNSVEYYVETTEFQE